MEIAEAEEEKDEIEVNELFGVYLRPSGHRGKQCFAAENKPRPRLSQVRRPEKVVAKKVRPPKKEKGKQEGDGNHKGKQRKTLRPVTKERCGGNTKGR